MTAVVYSLKHFYFVATWYGGGTIVGTAEGMYTPDMGLTWAVTLIVSYSTSFILCTLFYYSLPILIKQITYFIIFNKAFHFPPYTIHAINPGAFLFSEPLRKKNCVTMMDPFYEKYGKVLAAGLSMISVMQDILWLPATLVGLGKLDKYTFTNGCANVSL